MATSTFEFLKNIKHRVHCRQSETPVTNNFGAYGGARPGYGSGRMSPLRRSRTLPVCRPLFGRRGGREVSRAAGCATLISCGRNQAAPDGPLPSGAGECSERSWDERGSRSADSGPGLVQIGRLDVGNAERVLNAALDGGVTFLDTAECYGRSEEFIGRTIAHRRSEYVLATKVDTQWTGNPAGEGRPRRQSIVGRRHDEREHRTEPAPAEDGPCRPPSGACLRHDVAAQ